jgi:Na+/H+ antiporter NhaD/arsenite permease-like protein
MVTAIILCFVVGYIAIATEHLIKINKAATALLTGVVCWTLYAFIQTDIHAASHHLAEHLGEIAGILFFLMGAMTIVELIDAHDGFEVITDKINTRSRRKLIWMVCILTFFLSAVLDNLTTTIVMVSLIRKIISDQQQRLLFVSMVVIAANAGGAWSPIGDVTTTMLWIGGQITSLSTISHLIVPSLVCLVLPLLVVTWSLKGDEPAMPHQAPQDVISGPGERRAVFYIGILSLISVPVFKSLTHLPPYMGMMLALSVMWIVTEFIHNEKDERDKDKLSVLSALRKIDMPSVLFFFGILLAIGVLQQAGTLAQLAGWMDSTIGNINLVVMAIGALSAVVDNVPLVAGAMGMYSLETYPTDHYFWQFLAYSAGTGGSMLIIGSAAGVAAMGLEHIDFFWYLRRISLLALIGFVGGALVYIVQMQVVY